MIPLRKNQLIEEYLTEMESKPYEKLIQSPVPQMIVINGGRKFIVFTAYKKFESTS